MPDCLPPVGSCAEHYADELEECLDDAILQDFNVEAEDGSPEQASAQTRCVHFLKLKLKLLACH